MMLRFFKGRSMFRGSNDHLALRLRKLGFTTQQTVLLLWGISVLMAALAGLLVHLTEKQALVSVFLFAMLAMFFTLFISSIPMEEFGKRIKESPFRLFLGPEKALPKKKALKK